MLEQIASQSQQFFSMVLSEDGDDIEFVSHNHEYHIAVKILDGKVYAQEKGEKFDPKEIDKVFWGNLRKFLKNFTLPQLVNAGVNSTSGYGDVLKILHILKEKEYKEHKEGTLTYLSVPFASNTTVKLVLLHENTSYPEHKGPGSEACHSDSLKELEEFVNMRMTLAKKINTSRFFQPNSGEKAACEAYGLYASCQIL